MFRSRKNKSILSTLQDRELNNKCAPYFLSVSVISQLLRSDTNDSLYKHYWQKTSSRAVTYDCGYLYFSNYTACSSINGENSKPSSLFKMQKTKAKMKVSDVVSYSVPVYRTVDECNCKSQSCICLSQYLLSISEDNWLCQHVMANGKLIRQFYVNRTGHKFLFKYCDWDVYGDRFILTSILNPCLPKNTTVKKTDVVVNLAVFTSFPFEFLALLEIKRSVFGDNCTAANISDQHLILGLGYSQVHIYSFDDFLKEGDLKPYKLGDRFEDGKVGFYPTGLPLNFTYSTAPPLLFNVKCHGQIIRFGGYPYHYITAAPKNSSIFTVTNIETNLQAVGGCFTSYAFNEDAETLLFHPDHSNRLVLKTDHAVDCFKISNTNGQASISWAYAMGFTEFESEKPGTSSFGRVLKQRPTRAGEYSIFCTDYASDLELFAIMGIRPSYSSVGFVRLYDSLTGDLVRTMELKEVVCDSHFYQLYVDMGSIIIIERKTSSLFTVHVYNM